MGFTRSLSAVLVATLLSHAQSSFASNAKCVGSVSRESRMFKPTDVESQNLYSQYSYNSLERDSRFLVHVTSDPQHPLYNGSRKAKEALSENIGIKESLSNRLNIEAVMKDFELTRLQAVELQALLRRYFPKASNEDFLSVVQLVRAGKSMSGVRWEKIKKAKFVVALDVDGTLLDQDYQTRYPVSGVHQHVYSYGGKTHSVAMSPGWKDLIRGIKKRGGSIVIFSRNSDELIQTMFESIQIDGIPVAEIVDGIFSSSHMVINPADRKLIHRMKIHEIVTKDLRLVGGKKAIIIDDNPDFVLQKDQTRVVSRFDARSIDPETYYEPPPRDPLLNTKANKPVEEDLFSQFLSGFSLREKTPEKKTRPPVDINSLIQAREAELTEILKEIDLALLSSEKLGTSFADAYIKFAKKSFKILERKLEDTSHDLE
jgi:hypothetical protein